MKTIIGYALAVLFAVGGFATFVHQQRVIGAQNVVLAQTKHHRDSLMKALTLKDKKFNIDTVRVFRRIVATDTILQRSIDTAIVHQTDTVKITVKEIVEVQETIRACRVLVQDCVSIQRDLRGLLHDDSTTIKILRKQQPSGFRTWTERAVVAYASVQAGCLIGTGRLCLTFRVP